MTELPLQLSEREVLAGDPQLVDQGIDPVLADLTTANITVAIGVGILVGDAAIRQVLRGGRGPLGPKRERG